MIEYGSEKQVIWARRLLKNLRDSYAYMGVQDRTPEADTWGEAMAYASTLIHELEKEERAYIIIDRLKSLSSDPAKAAKQIRYWCRHGGNSNSKN